MDCKGIETVRRDNCELVKDVVDTSLRNILIEGEPDKAISHVERQIPPPHPPTPPPRLSRTSSARSPSC